MVYTTASTAHIAASCSTAEAESMSPVDAQYTFPCKSLSGVMVTVVRWKESGTSSHQAMAFL